MRIRFISWVAIGIASAFLVVASAAFNAADVAGVALGVGIGILVVSLGLAQRYAKHIPTLVTGLVTAVVSGWMIVSSQVFSLSTATDLTLASSLGLTALALVGLAEHELSTERVVHSLEVRAGEQAAA
jgi:uncharacterized membrane protein YesL